MPIDVKILVKSKQSEFVFFYIHEGHEGTRSKT